MTISFGNYQIKTRVEKGKTQVWDIVRSKWIILNPEEEVRQVWLHYLIFDLKISANMIAVEKRLMLNSKIKRFDICVFNNMLVPDILIECKAPNIKLKSPSLEQLSIYNLELRANQFIVTNGISHLGFKIKDNKIEILNELSN